MNEPPLIALMGNPNVGKSTLFNALTGMRQHTGNWPGKTVASARGVCHLGKESFFLLDVPGAYSLWAQSAEEEAALEAVCFGGADAVMVVCDASCLERNLNLAYQVLEITDRVSLCVNFMDEAQKKGLRVDLDALSRRLGVPVTGICAREGQGLQAALAAAKETLLRPPKPRRVPYPQPVAQAAEKLAEKLQASVAGVVDPYFAALRLMEGNPCFLKELSRRVPGAESFPLEADRALAGLSLSREGLSALLVESVYRAAEEACRASVSAPDASPRALRADRALTGLKGVPVLLALLGLIFFLTLKGANAPSGWLAEGFTALERQLSALLSRLGTPPFLLSLLTEGVFRTLGQVVSVMLPPMAVFFPLFTLLEDSGYLPRVAFTLDGLFERCRACGKQALTMCMGFGCNAVGVTGCRIIDSPRERLIAILTNSLVPCNGRFPLLIAMMTLFFSGGGLGGTAVSVAMLLGLSLLAVGATLLVSRLLSLWVLKGVPSSSTLELPPYRMPQVGRVVLRSMLDRTLFVLGRAAAVAAPAGLVIFLLSHIRLDERTLLSLLTGFLDPLGRLMGLDGVILAGFLLGFPANEIVLPLMVMAYTAGESLTETGSLLTLGALLSAQGWTWLTALNVMLFSLFHFPCSTTLLTIYRETGSKKWTLLAFLLPTAIGMLLCMITNFAAKIL